MFRFGVNRFFTGAFKIIMYNIINFLQFLDRFLQGIIFGLLLDHIFFFCVVVVIELNPMMSIMKNHNHDIAIITILFFNIRWFVRYRRYKRRTCYSRLYVGMNKFLPHFTPTLISAALTLRKVSLSTFTIYVVLKLPKYHFFMNKICLTKQELLIIHI